MRKFQTIEDVAQTLGDRGPHNPDVDFETYGELVDALINLGNTDKVFVHHDDHLGLKDDLSEDFLNSEIDDDNSQQYESETRV